MGVFKGLGVSVGDDVASRGCYFPAVATTAQNLGEIRLRAVKKLALDGFFNICSELVPGAALGDNRLGLARGNATAGNVLGFAHVEGGTTILTKGQHRNADAAIMLAFHGATVAIFLQRGHRR